MRFFVGITFVIGSISCPAWTDSTRLTSGNQAGSNKSGQQQEPFQDRQLGQIFS